jgi:hypothetical protein
MAHWWQISKRESPSTATLVTNTCWPTATKWPFPEMPGITCLGECTLRSGLCLLTPHVSDKTYSCGARARNRLRLSGSSAPSPVLLKLVSVIEPIGTLWMNAIRMTVVPMVVSLLITGVASSSNISAVGGIGWRALASFLGLLVFCAVTALLIVPSLFSWFHMDQSTIASLGGSAAGLPTAPNAPRFSDWIVDIVPTNPIRVASDGAMLPLVVFALVFGLALLKVTANCRDAVVNFFQGVGDAMLVIVRVIIELAPIRSVRLDVAGCKPNGHRGCAVVGLLRSGDGDRFGSTDSVFISGGGRDRTSPGDPIRSGSIRSASYSTHIEFVARVAACASRLATANCSYHRTSQGWYFRLRYRPLRLQHRRLGLWPRSFSRASMACTLRRRSSWSSQ